METSFCFVKKQMEYIPDLGKIITMERIVNTYGIHHVTIFCGSEQGNVDFYTKLIGQRFLKKTVNFDDPTVYHFYYGDEWGSPGTIITFFPTDKGPGVRGAGQVVETAYRIPAASLEFWTKRLQDHGVKTGAVERRFGETVLPFEDFDGVGLALVAIPGIESEPAHATQEIPQAHALRGFHGVTLLERDGISTNGVLANGLGFTPVAFEGAVTRFQAAGAKHGGLVDVKVDPGCGEGTLGLGSIHHVAFRAGSDGQQAEMSQKIAAAHGLPVTPQLNRNYFRSVYFKEPGGVNFEIATDAPGFAVDEPQEDLGKNLKLPPWLEDRRPAIEATLVAIR